jgi:transcriptional regulator with XRE-family HTH domain
MNEKELLHFDPHFTGNRLRQARESWGYTQADLAKRTGIGSTSISNWESGRCVPHLKNLWELLFVLQVGADDILGLLDGDVDSLKPNNRR